MANPLYDNIVTRVRKYDNFPRISRYQYCDTITDDEGDTYLETYTPIEFENNDDDKYHAVQSGEVNRLDLIAYKYYGNPLLYWVIAEASGITDPTNLPVGTLLRIPPKRLVYGL